MRRSLVLGVALALAVLVAGLPVTPAYAVDNVICVNTAGAGTCSQAVASIPLAIAAAGANDLDDTILVGPGTYSDGPYSLNGTTRRLTLRGAGQGSTIITLPASPSSQIYIGAQGASVQDLTISMVSEDSSNDDGLSVYDGALVVGVSVEGAGLDNATGVVSLESELSDVTVSLPGNNRAVFTTGGTTVLDSTLTAGYGFVASSNPADPNTLSRLTIKATIGVTLDGGVIDIDDSVVRITSPTGGVGLLAANYNNGVTPKTINARHVTVVGGGPGSVGVSALASALGAKQTSLVTLGDSIVRGQNSSLEVSAGNDGAQGGDSDATITAQYSSFDADTTSVIPGANGTSQIIVGAGVLDDPDPLFVDAVAGDYRLSAGSPLIDVGNPAAGGPATDRDGRSRVVDGNADGTARRDLGAHEYAAPPVPPADTTAPQTTLIKKPAKRVTSKRVRFRFTSSEAGSTFQCKRDDKAFRSCASPLRWNVGPGKHALKVRAIDATGNVDASPARYRFRRVEPS